MEEKASKSPDVGHQNQKGIHNSNVKDSPSQEKNAVDSSIKKEHKSQKDLLIQLLLAKDKEDKNPVKAQQKEVKHEHEKKEPPPLISTPVNNTPTNANPTHANANINHSTLTLYGEPDTIARGVKGQLDPQYDLAQEKVGLGPIEVPQILQILRKCLRKCCYYQCFETLVTSLFQDSIITFYFFHHMVTNLSCILACFGILLAIIGYGQIHEVTNVISSQAQTWDVWFKITIGIFIFASGFPFMIGALCKNIGLLILFLVLGGINLIAVICGEVLMRMDESHQSIDSILHELIDNPENDPQVVFTLDRIQFEFSCCGADNKLQSGRLHSCCFNHTDVYFPNKTHTNNCSENTTLYLNQQGCNKPYQTYTQDILSHHHIFFIFTIILLMVSLIIAACYIPLARKKKSIYDEYHIDDLDDPFRRSVLAASIFSEIDDELLADEALLSDEIKGDIEEFRGRVANCRTMVEVHRIIADSPHIIYLIKTYQKNPGHHLRGKRLGLIAAASKNKQRSHK